MTGYGNRRGPPENGLAGVDGAAGFDNNSAVTTRSPSFKPSTTSVTTPSLIPVLIWTDFGWLPGKHRLSARLFAARALRRLGSLPAPAISILFLPMSHLPAGNAARRS